MKNLISAMALTAALIIPGVASADAVTDRTDAIRLCRAEVQTQTGATTEQVRLDQVRVRAGSVRVDLDLWREGRLQNIRCDVSRGESLQIASITPALQTASAR